MTQIIRALRLLRRPMRVPELAAELGCSDATAKRLVAGIRAAGIRVRSVRDGREVTHQITEDFP